MAFFSGQILRVTWYAAMHDFRAAICRTYRVTGVQNGGPAPLVLSGQLWSDYAAVLLPLMNQSSEMLGVYIEQYPPPITPLEIGGVGPGAFGTGSLDPMPPQVAGLLRVRNSGPVPRRGGRVYMFFPGLSDTTDQARPTADYLTRLQAYGSQLLLPTTGQDLGPSPPFPVRTVTIRACMLPSTGGAPNFLALTEPQDRWSSQRRRSVVPYFPPVPFG